MIHRIKIQNEMTATEVIDQLVKNFSWRFSQVLSGEAVMYYNFYDQHGFEYNRSIYIKADYSNKHVVVYINRKEFPAWYREYLDDEIMSVITGYIDQVCPNGWEEVTEIKL